MSSYTLDWMELSIQWLITCGHFLWQGFAVAFVFLVMEHIATLLLAARINANQASTLGSAKTEERTDSSPAQVRYLLAGLALLSLPICIVTTFGWVHNTRGSILKRNNPSINNTVSISDSPSTTAALFEGERLVADVKDVPPFTLASPRATEAVKASEEPPSKAESDVVPIYQRLQFFAPILSAAYAMIVGLLLLRTTVSLIGSFRFRKGSQQVTDPALLELIRTQAQRLKLKIVPIVAICARVSSPVVVGIVRPMILLPPSLLCGLDATQLAAILSHEMAHIRRYDLVFNLVQRLVESLLFFHPIVWWLSRRVTMERENCCDDVAALQVGRLLYAEALVQMASICLAKHRSRSQVLATLAADGGNSSDFGYRIRRLMDVQATPRIRITKRSVALGVVAIGCMWASLVALAQSPPTKIDEPVANVSQDHPLEDAIQWSTWGAQDGLLSGARLLLPEGVVQPGQPVTVEYRLKNVSTEPKKLNCYVRKNWDYITLETNNFLRDMGINSSDETIEIQIEPGKEYVLTSHTATIDTTGLLPGEYHVALGTAFYYPDAKAPGTKHEIPHRGSMTFKVLGEANANVAQSLDKSIHWGEAISGLRLGAKFSNATNSFAVGDIVETDLWIANVSDKTIECSIRLPHPSDGWWLNVANDQGESVLLEREPFISIPFPQEFYKLKLAPGEVKPLTGDRIEGQPEEFAGRRAKFKIVSKMVDRDVTDFTIKEHLVTDGGNYSAKYHVVLERPDVPGLRIELDTGDVSFTVGQPNSYPRVARVLDEATDKSILWGEAVGGVRLGIRQAELSRKRTILRHGEHLDYEVWIKNETDEVLEFERDPREHQSPGLGDDRSINIIGSGLWASFFIPPEELVKANLILRPGEAARRFLPQSHSASIRPPGTPRGRFGSEPLLLEPGKYKVFAQFGDLKSGVEEIEVIPAARLQIRKSSRPTEKSREYAAQDPSDAIIEWQNGNGEKEQALFNWDSGVFIDERDLVAAEIVSVEGQHDKYSISLQLRPESAPWLSRSIASYSLWDDPDMVVVLLDDKPLGALRVPTSIADDKLLIPTRLTREQAESTLREIQAAMASRHAQLNATTPPLVAVPQTRGVKLVGEVKLPKDEWLFRRQVNQVPDSISRERPRGFKGDSLDPDDGRVIHELSWKDVIAIHVTVKANDGRDYLKTIQADEKGRFRLDEMLPKGSYQIDVNAVLTLDDNAQVLSGEPAAELRSGTQLIRVEQEDTGEKSLVFELFPVPFNQRVVHSDPAQRTTILGTLTQDNFPVPNAKVVLYGGVATRWKVAECVTDIRGQYRFENVIAEFLGVQIKHEKLVPADGKSWRDIDVEFGKLLQLDVPLTAGGYVTGQLLDEDNQPRANLSIRIMRTAPGFSKGSTDFIAYAKTDADGKFTSEPLQPGTYVIEENAKPYPVLDQVEVSANETTKL